MFNNGHQCYARVYLRHAPFHGLYHISNKLDANDEPRTQQATDILVILKKLYGHLNFLKCREYLEP